MAAMKKAQMEIGVAAIVTLVFVIMMFCIYTILTALQSSHIADNYAVANQTINRGITMFKNMDMAVPFVVFGLNIASLLTMFFLSTSPIFFFLSLIVLPLSIFINAAISNAYMSSLATMSVASSFPITTFFMQYLPLIMFGTDILGIILLYTIFKR